jgi:PAS domain S-box-containing protein
MTDAEPAKLRQPWFHTLAFLACAALFAFGAYAFLDSMTNLQAARGEVERSSTAVRNLYALQAQVLNAESGYKGFLLAGRADFLESYHQARKEYRDALRRVAESMAQEGSQRKRMSELQGETDQLFAQMADLVKLREDQGIEAAATVVGSYKGRDQAERIRALVADMRQHEEKRFNAWSAVEEQGAMRALGFAAAACVFGVIALVALYVLTHAYLRAERRRLNAELRDSAAVMDTVANTADLVYVKDTAGRLVKVNAAMEALFGKPREALLGKNDLDLSDDPAEAKRMREADIRVMREDRIERVEESFGMGGAKRTFLATKVPRHDSEGAVSGVIVIARDITERKRAEESLQRDHDGLAAAVKERTAELSELSRHLISVAEEEKASLARELHDEMGSSLAAISMDMGWILKRLRQLDPVLAERQERALAAVHATLDLKRRIVDGLRPLHLEHFGLEFALRALGEAFNGSTSITVETEYPEDPPLLGANANLALFRVVQECLTNVAKHAGAKHVRVCATATADALVVTIEDDGAGVPPDIMRRPGAHGILGMRERMTQVGGDFSIARGAQGRGTLVTVSVPLAQNPPASGEEPAPEKETARAG